MNNILNKLKTLVFNEEYLNQQKTDSGNSSAEAPKSPQASPINIQAIQANPSAVQEDMVSRVKSLVANMNQPGIDFMELWDAAVAMGSVNDMSISNAFSALKIASGNTLTKADILRSGENYIQQLSNALARDIEAKQNEKQVIISKQAETKAQLEKSVQDLTEQIQELQAKLAADKKNLDDLMRGADPKIAEIDSKIVSGQAAVAMVIKEMQTVMNLTEKNIK